MNDDMRQLTRRQLYDLVWKTPVDVLAKQFGMSGRGLGKLCERNSIPVPPRGYWARKTAGQRMKRPPLIEVGDSKGAEIVVDLTFRPAPNAAEATQADAAPDPVRELFERQVTEIGAIPVPDQLRNPHPLIGAWLKQEEAERQRARQSYYGSRSFYPRYATPLARRRLRILNVVFREMERRGCEVEADDTRKGDSTVRLGRDSVDFTLSERIRQIRRRLTAEEKAERHSARQSWTQIREQTGELILKLSAYTPKGVPQSWQDQQDRPLETQLAEVLAGLLTMLAHARERREQREAEDRRRWEREKEERRLQAEREAELGRKLGLRQRVKAWQVAAHIRGYVAAVDEAAAKGDVTVEPATLDEWRKWALAHADEIDPLCAGNAIGTDLLWTEERRHDPSYSPSSQIGRSGDPDWFWGRRWWLRR
jgi:hypothetical protein